VDVDPRDCWARTLDAKALFQFISTWNCPQCIIYCCFQKDWPRPPSCLFGKHAKIVFEKHLRHGSFNTSCIRIKYSIFRMYSMDPRYSAQGRRKMAAVLIRWKKRPLNHHFSQCGTTRTPMDKRKWQKSPGCDFRVWDLAMESLVIGSSTWTVTVTSVYIPVDSHITVPGPVTSHGREPPGIRISSYFENPKREKPSVMYLKVI